MQERYLALDGIRGIAAFAVVCLHFSLGVFPQRGYLAVDVFFVLSGFVIAHAYERKLLNGMTFAAFAKMRAARLYPMVFAGVGMVIMFASLLYVAGREDWPYTAVQVVFAALLIPYIGSDPDMFILLSPTWSLFGELVVNLAYAALAPRLSNRVLMVICAVAAAILVPATIMHGSVQFGPFRGTLLLGLVRTTFSFGIGVLIYRYRRASMVGPSALAAAGCAALAMLAMFAFGTSGLYDAVAVVLAIPLIIIVSSHVTLPSVASPGLVLLGDLSYPVYILHWPLRALIFQTGIQTKVSLSAFLLISCVVVSVCAYVTLKLYDEPVRRLLRKAPTIHPVTAP